MIGVVTEKKIREALSLVPPAEGVIPDILRTTRVCTDTGRMNEWRRGSSTSTH